MDNVILEKACKTHGELIQTDIVVRKNSTKKGYTLVCRQCVYSHCQKSINKHKLRIKEREKKRFKRGTLLLTDYYVKKMICRGFSGLDPRKIPMDLIEKKRKFMILGRQIREAAKKLVNQQGTENG